jgi:hypothetical protein
MAKQPTPETIAGALTPRERLALVVIREGKHLNWEGGGVDAEGLIKKRLIRRGSGGSLSLTTRGRDVLLALFAAEARGRNQPPPFAKGEKGGTAMLDVKGPASSPLEMGYSLATRHTFEPTAPPNHAYHGGVPGRSNFNPAGPAATESAGAGGQPASGGLNAAAFDTGAFEAGNANALHEPVPASPPYAAPAPDAFAQEALEVLLNPDPAVEREIAESVFKDEANETRNDRRLQAEPEPLPITLVNDKGKPIAELASNPAIQGGVYGPVAARESKKTAQGKPQRPSRKAVPKETTIKIKSRSQVVQYSNILIAALEEVVDYDPARHHNRPPPELRIDDEGYLTEIRNLIAELRTLNSLLETTRRQPKKASDAVVKLTRHFDTFLSCYAKSLAKGAGWLTIGVIASLLYQAGIGQEIIDHILSYAKLPR